MSIPRYRKFCVTPTFVIDDIREADRTEFLYNHRVELVILPLVAGANKLDNVWTLYSPELKNKQHSLVN